MRTCFKCGVDDSKALLFDVVSAEGIKKICRRCNVEEDLPLIKRSENVDTREFLGSDFGDGFDSSRRESLMERRKREFLSSRRKSDLTAEQDKSLRELVEKNYKQKLPEKQISKDNFIPNFHWVLMRARRMKKLTREQMALELRIPESAVRMLEEGVVPEGSSKMILKIEEFLGVKITRDSGEDLREDFPEELDSSKRVLKRQFQDDPDFDNLTTRSLTISDLQEMKEEKDRIFHRRNDRDRGKEGKFLDPFIDEDDYEDEPTDEEERLSKEELDKLIYGV